MSFEMADNHLMFLVTLPIHYGSNESSGTSIQQGTSEKHIFFRFKCDFCEKTTKIAPKTCFNVDLEIVLFVYKRM